ncbi:MAG TPA: 2Fe-2S iron-sulfur cluster-binding protein [Humisphaera sp.]
MPLITCGQTIVSLSDAETVLDGLLRAGVDVPNSCRAGACQSCLVRAVEGIVPPAAQVGLKDALKQQGYFLACACRPTTDLAVALAGEAVKRAAARVAAVHRLTADVARLHLACDDESFAFRPGQFANVARPDGLARPYSIASLPGEPIELHVRRVPNGRMSNWLFDDCRPGDALELRGPVGECFYTPGKPDQPMALVGTGTGLAPLYAIARDALRQGHTGPIRLYHAAADPSGLYLHAELTALAAAHANLSYRACVTAAAADGIGENVTVGDVQQVLLADVPKFAGWRVFLCGNPTLVAALRKKAFLAGASMKEIHSDAFVMRQSA